jgi:hypothetical protein
MLGCKHQAMKLHVGWEMWMFAPLMASLDVLALYMLKETVNYRLMLVQSQQERLLETNV